MRARLAEQWDSYCKVVLPRDVSTVQRWETRRAFYSGAQAFYALLMTQLEPGTEAGEADMQMMSDLDSELRQFSQQVKDGRA